MSVRTVGGIILGALLVLGGCTRYPDAPASPGAAEAPPYIIGPGDELEIHVWRNPDLSTAVPVRPDGRISVPLIEDLPAAGKTPSALGREIESQLATYVQEPRVTVIVRNFVGGFNEQVKIVGAAIEPRAVPYRQNMTILDAMIEVGGLTEFAAGNASVILRRTPEGGQQTYRARLDDLLRDGDVSANVGLMPGDIVIIPEGWL